jgi:hypothetical protein
MNGRLEERNFNIESKDFHKLDKAFRRKHYEYMGVDSNDNTMGIYTREQQIERYAKELSFWKTEMKSISNEKTKKNINKKHFIETMETGILSKMMMTFDDEMETLIEKRCKEMMNV